MAILYHPKDQDNEFFIQGMQYVLVIGEILFKSRLNMVQ